MHSHADHAEQPEAPDVLRAPCPCGCKDAAGSATAGGRLDPPLLDAHPLPPPDWAARRHTAALPSTHAPPVFAVDHVPI